MQEEYDRLSGLPDDTILDILSFLPTKSFVQTSSLAKRWRFLWADVPFSAFTCNGGHINECRLKDSSNTFHICDSSTPPRTDDSDQFECWIGTIFARNVRNLVLGSKPLRLPRRLLACTSLVDLIILNCENPPQNYTVHFPALKKLEVALISAKFISNLISGCPVIEELTIRTPVMAYICVSSPTLTRLVINTDMVVIETPALKYLRMRAHETLTYISSAYSSLDAVVEATLDLNRNRFVHSNHALVRFVGKLCNVKRLTLFTAQMQIPCSELLLRLTTKFHNLAELRLGADWRYITKFIENANSLRLLVIIRTDYHSTQEWIEPKRDSFMPFLENVQLYDFEWSTNNEFDMIKYILKYAIALRTISIIYTSSDYWREKVQVLNTLASFETQSPCVLFKCFYEQTYVIPICTYA